MRTIIFFALTFFVAAASGAESFQATYQAAKNNASINCEHSKVKKAYEKYGVKVPGQWSCTSSDQSVHLYVSEKKYDPGQLNRILLKTERTLSGDFTKKQKIFVSAVMSHFLGKGARAAEKEFYGCKKSKQRVGNYRVEFDCYSGASIRTNAVFFYPDG